MAKTSPPPFPLSSYVFPCLSGLGRRDQLAESRSRGTSSSFSFPLPGRRPPPFLEQPAIRAHRCGTSQSLDVISLVRQEPALSRSPFFLPSPLEILPPFHRWPPASDIRRHIRFGKGRFNRVKLDEGTPGRVDRKHGALPPSPPFFFSAPPPFSLLGVPGRCLKSGA